MTRDKVIETLYELDEEGLARAATRAARLVEPAQLLRNTVEVAIYVQARLISCPLSDH